MMPGIVRKNNQPSTAGTVGIDRAQSHTLLSRRGAILLLILLLLAIGIVAMYWRIFEVQKMVSTTVNLHSQSHHAEERIKEKDMMKSTELNATDAPAAISADIQVNGKSIALPPSGTGSVHEENVSDDGMKTTVDVNVDSSTTGSRAQGQSTLNLQVQSEQVSESETSQ